MRMKMGVDKNGWGVMDDRRGLHAKQCNFFKGNIAFILQEQYEISNMEHQIDSVW